MVERIKEYLDIVGSVVMWCSISLVAVLVTVGVVDLLSPPEEITGAAARNYAGAVVVYNHDTTAWENCDVVLNGGGLRWGWGFRGAGYAEPVEQIPAGGTWSGGYSDFTNPDNERFDVRRLEVKTIDVYCGGMFERGHLRGSAE